MKRDMKRVVWLFALIALVTTMGYFSCTHRPLDLPAPAPASATNAPAGLSYTPNSIHVKTGVAVSSVKPTIKGTQPINFSLSTSPANGGNISINNQGIITVANTASAGTYLVTVTAANEAGSATFNNVYQITVSNTISPPTSLSYASNSLIVNQGGSSITSAPPTVIGTHPIHFSSSGTPSSNLITINDSTGAITVSSGIAAGTYVLNVTASNSAGTKTFNNVYTVVVKPGKPSELVYSPAFMNTVAGSSAASAVPTVKGTLPMTFTLTSNPASGLITIDNSGKIMTGSGLGAGTYSISVTAANVAGSTTFTNVYSIKVDLASAPPSRLTYLPNSITLGANQGGSSVVPTVSGTTPMTYSIITSPSTSAITVNSTTGVITAASNLPIGNYTINVTAKNSVGTQLFANAYTIAVVASSPSALSYSPNTITVADDAAGTSAVPTIMGTTPITYSITTSPSASGIAVNNSNGVISVAKSTALGTYTVTVNARNMSGSTSATYTVAVVPSFNIDIQPIMAQYCGSCHNQFNGYSGTKSDISNILQRVQLPSSNRGFMPQSGPALSTDQINLIKQWQSTGMNQ